MLRKVLERVRFEAKCGLRQLSIQNVCLPEEVVEVHAFLFRWLAVNPEEHVILFQSRHTKTEYQNGVRE